MKHKDFQIGTDFRCGGNNYRCTDVGARTITAIRIGPYIEIKKDCTYMTLTQSEAEEIGWFNGPPYALAERSFNEHDFPACHLLPKITLAPDAKETVLKTYIYNKFVEWLYTSNVDFWSESNAPEELADIAVKVVKEFDLLKE